MVNLGENIWVSMDLTATFQPTFPIWLGMSHWFGRHLYPGKEGVAIKKQTNENIIPSKNSSPKSHEHSKRSYFAYFIIIATSSEALWREIFLLLHWKLRCICTLRGKCIVFSMTKLHSCHSLCIESQNKTRGSFEDI